MNYMIQFIAVLLGLVLYLTVFLPKPIVIDNKEQISTPSIVGNNFVVPVKPVKTSIQIKEIVAPNKFEMAVNQYRKENRLTEWKALPCLRQRSEMRIHEIQSTFSHIRPNGNHATAEPYCNSTKHGENLADNLLNNDSNALLTMWLNSPSHKAILDSTKYTYMGLVVSGEYAVLEVSN